MSLVQLVKSRFHGGTFALFGGDDRPRHRARLTEAFGLADVIWVPTRDSNPSPNSFAGIVGRDDVSLVVSLLGLLRHQHAHDLRRLCRRYGRPLVTYWRSPNADGLAAAILAQRPDLVRLVPAT